MKLKRGSTSVRRLIFVADSSSTTGAGLANLTYNSAGLVWYYFAGDLSNEVQVTLATATLGTFASGGFIAVDNTNMPGWYEIGIPDAALDGGNECAMQLRGATNMVPVNVYIELDAVDYQTAVFGAATAANVNAEVLDVLNVDTFAELSSPPAATSTLRAKITWLFMWARNKSTQTATERKLYADDTTTVISTETVSDDGTTFTKGEAA